ncbi:hypothetical protein C942_04332 [Photobacterium marinum]|uniref:Lipoprotein n=1 Tax=Photobacterium marinum TaxID=1056511 RepID=L8JGK2_9GAMM|nr:MULTISPECIES: hypothetical protein [Photobacterium]ELR66634.1 hypothetical protein C942_04332 [Photobacterium marinum]
MKKLTLISIIFSGLLLSGCQLTHIEGEVDGVNIKASTNDKNHHGNGSFCPPGQAKKGNC